MPTTAADNDDTASNTLTGVEMCLESLTVQRKFIAATIAGDPKANASASALLTGIEMCVDSLNALHANLEKPLLFDARVDNANAKWLEEVFAAPDDDTGAFRVTVYSQLRYALMAADSRRVDKRHTVAVDGIKGVIDLSLFANAHKVCLSNLPQVVDVSSLRGVHALALNNLPLVVDVSSLRGVHALRLFAMDGVVDVSSLRGVHTLHLLLLLNVADISMLRGVEELYVYNSPLVSGVSTLACVPILHVDKCGCSSVVRGNIDIGPFGVFNF